MYEILSIQATEADGVTEPVTVAEAKAWANIDLPDNEVIEGSITLAQLITSMIKGARMDLERLTSRKLVPHDVTLSVSTTGTSRFQLPYGSPASVILTDEETEDTVDTSDFKLTAGVLKILNEGTYGVAYTVGSSNAGLNELVKMIVTYRYNNRGDGETALPEDIIQRANQYRLEWL